ncbi:MAG: hypothetical protein BWY69_00655 [Planctomycetes bacterium ADurb.Bin401]|nr:MAG: hypothetical protein BWY69_00655 [Planctomycetes bacterium ADurb.Bin401]
MFDSTSQKENQAMASPLKNLFWWDLLMAFWILAEDYKFEWAKSFPDRIISLDINWLKSAMNQTFHQLNPEDQTLLCKEYEDFLRLDKVCNWKKMCKGHEYIAIICTQNFRHVRLKRSVLAWSLKEAKAKLKLSSSEILVGWKRPWESEYINEQQTSGEITF